MSTLLILTALALLVTLLVAYIRHLSEHRLTIPTLGFSGWLSSWITAFSWVLGGAPKLVRRGYTQSHIFKVANLDNWLVLVSQSLTHELRRLPDDVASFMDAADDFMQSEYTHKKKMVANPWHVAIVRNKLTKYLPELCPILSDELSYALEAEINVDEDWSRLPALATVQHIVARASSRVLVGQELARNSEYRRVALNFALDVVVRARVINFFPKLLKPLAGRICLLIPSLVDKGIKLLEPEIVARAQNLHSDCEEPQSESDGQLDVINWLIQAAPVDDCSARTIAIMLMNLNLATIYSTSMVLTHVLYNIASGPEYVAPLRAEVEDNIEMHGWSKRAFGSMTRLDSFLKETLRFNGTAAYSGMRKILRRTMLSNGTWLEPGTIVAVATLPTHCDASLYPNADRFLGFRFHDLREEFPEKAAQQSAVAANDDFLVFGLGRHVCLTSLQPGRFFAVLQIKIALAQILLAYDVALDGKERPQDKWVGESCIPNPTASLRFRRRKTPDV